MRVYLSGKMRGVPDLNRDKFAEAANKLRKDGHEVFNPAAANLEWMTLPQIFKYETAWMCDHAEAIAVIQEGHETSLGVAAEVALAKVLGLQIIPL